MPTALAERPAEGSVSGPRRFLIFLLWLVACSTACKSTVRRVGSIVKMLAIDFITPSHSDLAFGLCHVAAKLAMCIKNRV